MKKFVEKDVAENPLYHDTWKLLKKYRDVVWSLEISVQHVRSKFEIEYGTSIEEFLDSIYLAGADLNGSDIEHHAKCIERSHKMLKLLDSAVELLRTRHKNGEAYYWLLYYSFLSPQQLKNVEEIIENLRPHIRDISFRTYYRRRREAIDALSSVSLLFHCSFSCLRAVPSFSTRIIKAHLLMNQGDLLFPFKGGMDYDL